MYVFKKYLGIVLFGIGLAYSSLSLANNTVVVVPLFGNGPELKPIKISDAILRHNTLFFSSHVVNLGNQTASRRIIITSITVSPKRYDIARKPLSINFCINPDSGCLSDYLTVPNNTTTTLDFGIGIQPFINFSGTMFVRILDRGGIPQGGNTNGISVYVTGYFLDGF